MAAAGPAQIRTPPRLLTRQTDSLFPSASIYQWLVLRLVQLSARFQNAAGYAFLAGSKTHHVLT